MISHQQSHQSAISAAQRLLSEKFIIVDTETTGFGKTDQVIQISAINPSGIIMLDAIIRPSVPIGEESIKVHGIDNHIVENAVTFPDIYPAIASVIQNHTHFVAYNAEFDIRLINQTAVAHSLPPIPVKSIICIMRMYAEYYGCWNEKRKSYVWQKLEGGDHSSAGDCRATLNLLRQIAEGTAKKFI